MNETSICHFLGVKGVGTVARFPDGVEIGLVADNMDDLARGFAAIVSPDSQPFNPLRAQQVILISPKAFEPNPSKPKEAA